MKSFIIPEIKITQFDSERVLTNAADPVYVSAVSTAEDELRRLNFEKKWLETGEIVKFVVK